MTARLIGIFALGMLFVSVLPFAIHSMQRGSAASLGDIEAIGRLFGPVRWSDYGLYLHMITGGVLTALTALQLLTPVRRRWPGVHRASGRVMVGLSLITALTGLVYIGVNGTIGGPMMNVGFALYGALMAIAAVQTFRLAYARRIPAHREWALRLAVLALGSWLYRVHYGIWEMATGGIASTPEFTGTFDRTQNFAFFVPYLLLLELLLAWQRSAKR